jgi:hypothetical protein
MGDLQMGKPATPPSPIITWLFINHHVLKSIKKLVPKVNLKRKVYYLTSC